MKKFIKRLFGKKFDIKDFENVAIANEQFILHSFQIQLEKTQGMNEDEFFNNTDLIQFMEYPLEKRFKLFLEAPELEKKIFDWEFKEFIKWILEKEEENDLMRKYCDKVKELIKKYKIEF